MEGACESELRKMHNIKCGAVPRFAAAYGIVPSDIDAMCGEVSADWREIRSVQRDASRRSTGEEIMRGPRNFLFTPGGSLSLFAAPRRGFRSRMLIARGPFEALCAAAYDGHREDTIYAAPPGRLTPRAREALLTVIPELGVVDVVVAVSPRDDNLASSILEAVNDRWWEAVTIQQILPPEGDWAKSLRALRGRQVAA